MPCRPGRTWRSSPMSASTATTISPATMRWRWQRPPALSWKAGPRAPPAASRPPSRMARSWGLAASSAASAATPTSGPARCAAACRSDEACAHSIERRRDGRDVANDGLMTRQGRPHLSIGRSASPRLFDLGAGRVAAPVVLQGQFVDLAQVDIMPDHARVAWIRPLDLEIPLAALVRGVELHIDAVAVGKDAARRQLIVRPVVVARIVEAEKLDPVSGAVDDRHVAQVCRE